MLIKKSSVGRWQGAGDGAAALVVCAAWVWQVALASAGGSQCTTLYKQPGGICGAWGRKVAWGLSSPHPAPGLLPCPCLRLDRGRVPWPGVVGSSLASTPGLSPVGLPRCAALRWPAFQSRRCASWRLWGRLPAAPLPPSQSTRSGASFSQALRCSTRFLAALCAS